MGAGAAAARAASDVSCDASCAAEPISSAEMTPTEMTPTEMSEMSHEAVADEMMAVEASNLESDSSHLGSEGSSRADDGSLGAAASAAEANDEESVDREGDEDSASSQGEGDTSVTRKGKSFSPLERLLLLREVQLLRFVDTEFLPYLAQIAAETRVDKGELVCEQGTPSNGSLIIVAHGTLELSTVRRAGSHTFRKLHTGDILGTTTALLSDSKWQYSARALEDTWTLTISSVDLADVLRGRAELAHAVLRGFYYTFFRRIRQIVERGGSVKRDWLLASDVYSKSPQLAPRTAQPLK